ncbi:NUDIX domain-containing protein [Jannaschia sp. M317]|uniref:NUDIX domain-containing protein n=1 Tax=Jannaschia sp. M317 TaxID=2867011 RepID=UPI0021A8B5DF|nr:NUDIX domain-containing protein [Jannaschia sp. M317]UWQ17248.1 NUDIX domain-containing protein [Jannaschia sp. M317]
MSGFAASYLGRLRARVGAEPLLNIGARLLIEDDAGRFLNIRRADDGKWGLLSGGMELGESLMDTARREAREEANADVRDLTPFGLSSDPIVERHVYPNGDQVQAVCLLIHARLNPGPLRANDGEATAFRFVTEAEVDPGTFCKPEYPTFAHWRAFRDTGQFQVV